MSRKVIDELEHLKYLAKPFHYEGSEVGVLLVHGFTASTTETLPLGKLLHKKGYTAHGVLLAGHGTDYHELPNYTWQDWFQSVENGFFFLQDRCESIIPIGVSLGAILCLNLVHQRPNSKISKLVLLAPPFALKSRLVALTPILTYFKKFLYKGGDSLQYFKDHNLYSYMYRPTKSITQLLLFLKYIHDQPISVSTPTLIAYGALDEMISISEIEKARKQKFAPDTEVKILRLPKSGHIITVEPGSEELFETIDIFVRK